MRALIADDEPIARQVLREQLEEIGGVSVVGEAATGLEAVELIDRLHPDLVLLDLQMPGLDGFSVARRLKKDRHPAIIFVTAYDRHALEAFDIGALDYLLKPVRRERLEAALQRVRLQAPPPPKPVEPLRRIVGRLRTDLHMLDPNEVVAFQADGETVYILATSGRYVANYTLKALEERLPTPQFRRVHRKTIINTNHIRKISPLSSKRWLLTMSNGLEVIVSKRMAGAIREEAQW
ncbi:MAG: response regulator transcription factor [Bryobacterales bacterium]|nr:response regulator transcription factor [Bryobacterales bacterium]